MNAQNCIAIFDKAIADYHKFDDILQPINNPFNEGSIEHVLYLKSWIDTVQWHFEDLIRDPKIEPIYGMELKRKIDASNQHRTDVVEQIDDFFISFFSNVISQHDAKLNTESPGWVVDRISILCLKIYHMQEQVARKDAGDEHIIKCTNKLDVLLAQKTDLITSFNQLLEEFKEGSKIIKVYRQMKMYNDDNLNPVLYKK